MKKGFRLSLAYIDLYLALQITWKYRILTSDPPINKLIDSRIT